MKQTVTRWILLFCLLMVIIGCGDGESLDGRVNSPPVIDYLIVPEMVNPGDSVELQVLARDIDGDILNYVWEVEKGKLDSRTERTVNWTVPSDAKWAIVKVSVNDGVNKPAVKSRKIPINLQNSAPVVTEIVIPESVHAGSSLQLQAKTDDADGDTLTYNWEVEAGLLSSETTHAPTWTVPIEMGSITVTLHISDGINEPAAKSITVRVIHSLIVEGKQAAGIKLGDSFVKVKAMYGKPSNRDESFFAYWEPDIGISGFVDGIDLVESLFIRKPNKAKTAGRIGVGSARERVEEEFGTAEEIKENGEAHWYWNEGIHFDYDGNSRVSKIHIFKPIKRHGAAPQRFADVLILKQELVNLAALDKYYATE